MNFKFDNVYLLDSFVIGGDVERKGQIASYIDYFNVYKEKNFENNEMESLYSCIDHLFERNNININDIDLAISGELSNQLAISHYTYRKLLIPFIGVYSACSTICLEIGLSSLLLQNDNINKILISTSSNTECAERQFRNPNEYGGEKLLSQTYTSTISCAAILTNEKSKIKITSFTLGKIIDIGFTDVNDFGRAMTPCAIETLLTHFKLTNTEPKDYDLILTGDLSKYGYELVKKSMIDHFVYIDNYNDCGLLLYDVNSQNVFAGGSGPGTSAGVLFSYVKKQMLKGELKKVLLCATGALISPTMIAEGESIPCIAHCIVMEASL